MGLFRKRAAPQQPQLSRTESLACVPVVSAGVRTEPNAEGLTRVRYPVAVRPLFSGLARKLGADPDKPTLRTLELDRMGSTVWPWIDGQRSVGELSTMLAERYELHPREAEVSMSAFVRELGQRGIVALRQD